MTISADRRRGGHLYLHLSAIFSPGKTKHSTSSAGINCEAPLILRLSNIKANQKIGSDPGHLFLTTLPGTRRRQLGSDVRPSLKSHAHLSPTMLSLLSTSMANMRQTIAQALNFALVLSTAFMMWKGLSVASASSSPIVVVLSGSMEPAFQRGDLLFLWNRSPTTELGEVVVYNVRGKDIPIVHRVIRTFPEVEEKTKRVKEITVYVETPSTVLWDRLSYPD